MFCQKTSPDVLYVLGGSFIKDIPLLERDIRALDPEEIVKLCKAISLAPEVRILEKNNLESLKSEDSIVFADDEVMHFVAENYLSDTQVLFEKVFLRWDKMASITSQPIDPDITLSRENFDREIMSKARGQAEKSSDWWRQVGAVIVKNGQSILEGFNQHNPTEYSPYINGDPRANFNAGDPQLKDMNTALHGEAGLIASAAQKGISLEGTSIYVTTFPCPTCALSIIHSGIKHVYYADGYSNLNAQENLKLAGIKVIRVQEN